MNPPRNHPLSKPLRWFVTLTLACTMLGGCATKVVHARKGKVVIHKRSRAPVGYILVQRPKVGKKCIIRQSKWYCRS